MSESLQHLDLVSSLKTWIHGRYNSTHGDLFVLADLPSEREKPYHIGGFRPDVYARAAGSLVVLGEAKTTADLEAKRTERQLAAFLTHLRLCPEPLFVMATPWIARATAHNLVLWWMRRLKITTVPFVVLPEPLAK